MISFQEVSQQLDRLFFQPFKEGETVDIRFENIQAYMKMSGWNWASYLEAEWMENKN